MRVQPPLDMPFNPPVDLDHPFLLLVVVASRYRLEVLDASLREIQHVLQRRGVEGLLAPARAMLNGIPHGVCFPAGKPRTSFASSRQNLPRGDRAGKLLFLVMLIGLHFAFANGFDLPRLDLAMAVLLPIEMYSSPVTMLRPEA